MITVIQQIRDWDCFLSFNVLFFISFLCSTCFYIMELLLWRKSTFENPFAQNFQISNLCICTGPHESLFVLFQLFTYFIVIIISICRFLPHLIKCFYVAQAFYFALNTSETFISSALWEQTCWKSESYITPQTMKLKWVLRLSTAEWTVMSAPLCGCDRVEMHLRKKKLHLIHFLCFTVSFFLFFVVEKKIVFTCGF